MTKLKTIFLILLAGTGFTQAERYGMANFPWYVPFDVSLGYGIVETDIPDPVWDDYETLPGKAFTISADWIFLGEDKHLKPIYGDPMGEMSYSAVHMFMWGVQTRFSYNVSQKNVDFYIQPTGQYQFFYGLLNIALGPDIGFTGTKFDYGASFRITGLYLFQFEFGWLWGTRSEIMSLNLNIPINSIGALF